MEEVREPMGMLKIDHIRTMLKMPRIEKCWEEKYGKKPTEEDAQTLFEGFEENLFHVLDQHAELKPDGKGITRCPNKSRLYNRIYR